MRVVERCFPCGVSSFCAQDSAPRRREPASGQTCTHAPKFLRISTQLPLVPNTSFLKTASYAFALGIFPTV